MAPDDPDERDRLWQDEDPTHRDPSPAEPVTEPHHSLDFLAGREAGFSEGVAQALAALEIELKKAQLTPAEIARIRSRVQTGAHDRG